VFSHIPARRTPALELVQVALKLLLHRVRRKILASRQLLLLLKRPTGGGLDQGKES